MAEVVGNLHNRILTDIIAVDYPGMRMRLAYPVKEGEKAVPKMDIASRVLMAQGDLVEANALIEDYLPLIASVTSGAVGRAVNVGEDDETAIAMVGFHDAIRTYSKIKGPFVKYASVVMRNRIIDYQRRENRHSKLRSLDEEMGDVPTLLERIPDENDMITQRENRLATRAEIREIAGELQEFGISLTDIAQECPQQERTLLACHRVIAFGKEHPELIRELKEKKRLPVAALCMGSGVERKTVERHRKYIIALLIIYSNGFELIRGHLREVFVKAKGGARN